VKRSKAESPARLEDNVPAYFRLRPVSLPLINPAFAVSLAILCNLAVAVSGALAEEQAGNLPTLTTTHQAHSLTSREAAREYPIHIKGVVTYFDQDYGPGYAAIFLHDSTGSIFVKPLSTSIDPIPVGSVIDVRGVSGIGGYAPVVAKPHITVIGHEPLPPNPPRVSLAHLQTGAEDAQWVEVEGTIHSVLEYPHSVTMQLAMSDGTVILTMPREAGATYSNLVDAEVRVHANAAPTINLDSQMIGVHLMGPGLSTIKIIAPAPGDPFTQPLTPIGRLLHWDEYSASFHRVHVRGNVTLQWPGSWLCIRDADRGICVQTTQDARFALGDSVDIVGFAGTENYEPILTDALVKKNGTGGLVESVPVSAAQALRGDHASDLIQIDGKLIGDNLASSEVNLMLSSGNTVFAAVLPRSMMADRTSPWKIGSTVRVTGICSVQIDARSNVREGIAVTRSFRVLMRSPQDVLVLQGPSWWTPGHILVLLALALIATLCVLGWVMVLQRRVAEQTRLLRESEGRFRHMALHDALTGLATRLLLDDRLTSAVEAAKRHETGVALLMIDVDKFKNINDTFGHHCGDEVLRVTASRLAQVVRKTDTVARMGGDEFVVLLPDLDDPPMVEGVAAKIVKSLAEPIPFAGREVPVSVSVGVCTSAVGGLDDESLLKCADDALYRAKAKGRNCFHVCTPDPQPGPTEPIA
jgi:diguanylate cyclase (GGDEF)-like protein